MKVMIYLLAGFLLTSFAIKKKNEIDGIWLGYYRSDIIKEKVIVKFNAEDKLEFYIGGVDDRTKCNGSYQLLGDSVSFTYTTPEGEEYIMQGHISYRKNYLDGFWKSKGKAKGSFFLEKQDVEEKFIQP
jgi:hypothetical protein